MVVGISDLFLWQVQTESASLARSTFNRDMAPMGLDDVLDNGKAQSCAAQSRVGQGQVREQ